MKVLFITYQFPPLNVGGSQRPFRFVKYLPDFGIQPTIITLDPQDYTIVYPNPAVDNSLLQGVKDKMDIRFVKSENLLKARKGSTRKFLSIFFNIYRGSEGKFWKRNFIAKTESILKEENFDIIFVTAPPFGVLPLAKNLAKKFNLPLVVDMRDAWTFWIATPYSNYFNFLSTKRLERMIFQYASKVIVTSKQTLADFQNTHPKLENGKFSYIPNGYDGTIHFDSVGFTPNGKIKIGYVGSFYYSPEARDSVLQPFWKKKRHRIFQYVPRKEDWLYRSPFFFLKSMEKLFESCPPLKDQIEIHFAGNKPAWLEEMIAQFGLEKNVYHSGFLSHSEIIKFQRSCDFLLITSSKVLGGRDYSIAGKTFEYFTLGKPILAFVTEGAQKDLLKESNMSVMMNPDEPEGNIKILKKIFTQGLNLKINKLFVEGFHSKRITENLSEIFTQLRNKNRT